MAKSDKVGTARREARMTVFQLGDLLIAYAKTGQGPPLALLHGGLDDSRSWRRQIDGLKHEFTVLAWDAPGCGQSSDVPESWRMADYADAVAAWLRGVGIERPHVLGLSWGSSVALELYRRHPQLPASLILASAYAGWAGSLSPQETSARLHSVLAAAGLHREELLEGWSGVFSVRASPELREELMAIWEDNAGSRNPGGYRAMAYSMAEANLRDVLPRIQVPTLLLYGELDVRSPLKVANALHAEIPRSRLVVIEDAGHLANAEAPEEFNARVREFVRSIVRG